MPSNDLYHKIFVVCPVPVDRKGGHVKITKRGHPPGNKAKTVPAGPADRVIGNQVRLLSDPVTVNR